MRLVLNRRQLVGLFLVCTVFSSQLMAVQPGEPAPGLVLPLLGVGQDVSLSEFKGKVVYVDFWASWCGPCRQSLPLYEALYKRLSTNSFQLLAVNLDEDASDARRFLDRHPVSYPILADPTGDSAREWSVLAMPSSYLVNANGKLVHSYIGFKPSHMEQIERDIKNLLDSMPGNHAFGAVRLRGSPALGARPSGHATYGFGLRPAVDGY